MPCRAPTSFLPHTVPMRTLGVEEEFLLVTPEGRPTSVAVTVLRHAAADGSTSDEPGGDVEKEFKQEQIETSTPPRADLGELAAEIRAGRAALRRAKAGRHVIDRLRRRDVGVVVGGRHRERVEGDRARAERADHEV